MSFKLKVLTHKKGCSILLSFIAAWPPVLVVSDMLQDDRLALIVLVESMRTPNESLLGVLCSSGDTRLKVGAINERTNYDAFETV
jgi:inosine-uridine nucleoside N-ribohydrolase